MTGTSLFAASKWLLQHQSGARFELYERREAREGNRETISRWGGFIRYPQNNATDRANILKYMGYCNGSRPRVSPPTIFVS